MLKNFVKTIVIMTFGTLGCVSLATSVANADEPIKIGTFLSVTGGASFLGDPELKTMQMSNV